MPLSVSDPRYRAEYAPPQILDLGRGLRTAFARPADAFGAKGNTVHLSGYHRSRAWVLRSPDSRYRASDYSVRAQADQGGDDNWIAAFDFTPGVWGTAENRSRMTLLTRRLYDAARARDPRLASLREIAGTLDGRTVVTFNCSDGSFKAPFDSSHLDHIHGSLWRSRAAANHSGILSVMLGTKEDDMAGELADAVLTQWAWGIGSFTQPGGGDRPIAPVHWRTKDEAWQAQVSAALAADATRDAAMAAAINALVTAVNAGSTGTPLDSATIVAVVRQEAAQTRQALLAQAEREAAAARAEADALADGPAGA